MLLAPTVNLHRSPLGGRHFEAYREDPLLTGAIGAGYVRGVQDGGVGATVKHFVANDAETERFTVDNRVGDRALRELYLAPFEAHRQRRRRVGGDGRVQRGQRRDHDRARRSCRTACCKGEWGFDGVVVSDWLAARATVADRARRPRRGHAGAGQPVYGEALAAAVRAGAVRGRAGGRAGPPGTAARRPGRACWPGRRRRLPPRPAGADRRRRRWPARSPAASLRAGCATTDGVLPLDRRR